MVEALRRLRREIDSIRVALRRSRTTFVTSRQALERIQQLFSAWSANVRPRLASSGIPVEVINTADAAFGDLVRLTSHRSRRLQYLRALLLVRRVLVEQVLLEVARIPTTPALLVPPVGPDDFIPEIPDLRNELIPNALLGWIQNMRNFLRTYNFDRNVFVMVSYQDRLAPLIKGIKETLVQLGLNGIVAREHRLTDDLYNPIACLLCCNYGIAIFDRPEPRQTHNPNIVYELATMQFLKRPCVILKHQSVTTMPSDFLQRLYESYRTEQEAVQKLREWWARITVA